MSDEELIEALRPLARIADEYASSNLDQHRPEWGARAPEDIELLSGRGGKRLLTLADAIRAWRAIKGAEK